MSCVAVLLTLVVLLAPALAGAQAPVEDELVLQTSVSRFVVDAALKAFADYAKERWSVTVRTSAQHAGTPVAYNRVVEWKGKPEADIFWGGESALLDRLAEQKLLVKHDLRKGSWSTRCRRDSGSPSRSRSRTRMGTGSAQRSSPTAWSIIRG